MRIFVHGSQNYLVRRKVEELKKAFQTKFDESGMNLVEFPSGNQKLSLAEAANAIKTPPFLAPKRMVVLSGLLSLKKADAEEWVELLQSIPSDVIVVLVDGVSVAKATKHYLFKMVSEKDDPIYAFDSLTPAQLNAWATRLVAHLEMAISPTLLRETIAMVGSDLSQLRLELHKLASFADGKEVTKEIIAVLVHANFDDQMFALMDAIGAGQKSRALNLLEQQRLFGTGNGQLFGMLSRQVRLLLGARLAMDENPMISKAALAKVLKVHSFVAQKTLGQAKNLATERLMQLHQQAMNDDLAWKTGGINETTAVDRLVAGFLL